MYVLSLETQTGSGVQIYQLQNEDHSELGSRTRTVGEVVRRKTDLFCWGSCRLKVKGWDESSTKVLGCAGGGVVPEGIVMYQSYAQQKFNRLWALEHK